MFSMLEKSSSVILFIIDVNKRYNHVMEVRYIHQREDWPNFRWDTAALADQLASVRNRQGYFLGKIHSLGFGSRESLTLEVLTDDVQKTSEIEGDLLERTQVRSSVARRLGLESVALAPADRRIESVVVTLLDAAQHQCIIISPRGGIGRTLTDKKAHLVQFRTGGHYLTLTLM